jgi:RNA polymerase sigma-70 factor (ECF subfamily)
VDTSETFTQYRPLLFSIAYRMLGSVMEAYQALDEEMVSFQRSQAEVRGSEPLPDVPLAVISSASLQDFPPSFSADYYEKPLG